MNRKFTVPATPAVARRIMALARLDRRAEIAPEIRALAGDTAKTVVQQVIQYLADVDFRAVVVGKNLPVLRSTVLQAALLHGVHPIMVHIDISTTWTTTLREANQTRHSVNKTSVTEITDAIYVGDIYSCEYLMKMGRSGLLITENESKHLGALSKEFAKCVILTSDLDVPVPIRRPSAGHYSTPLASIASHIVAPTLLPLLNDPALLFGTDAPGYYVALKRIASLFNISTHFLES